MYFEECSGIEYANYITFVLYFQAFPRQFLLQVVSHQFWGLKDRQFMWREGISAISRRNVGNLCNFFVVFQGNGWATYVTGHSLIPKAQGRQLMQRKCIFVKFEVTLWATYSTLVPSQILKIRTYKKTSNFNEVFMNDAASTLKWSKLKYQFVKLKIVCKLLKFMEYVSHFRKWDCKFVYLLKLKGQNFVILFYEV